MPATRIEFIVQGWFCQSHLGILMKFIIEEPLDLIVDGIQAPDFNPRYSYDSGA